MFHTEAWVHNRVFSWNIFGETVKHFQSLQMLYGIKWSGRPLDYLQIGHMMNHDDER